MFRGLILVRIIPREINTQGEEFKKIIIISLSVIDIKSINTKSRQFLIDFKALTNPKCEKY